MKLSVLVVDARHPVKVHGLEGPFGTELELKSVVCPLAHFRERPNLFDAACFAKLLGCPGPHDAAAELLLLKNSSL